MISITYYNDSSYSVNMVTLPVVKRELYWTDPEKYRRIAREEHARWVRENPERAKEINHACYIKNKPQVLAKAKIYRSTHKEEVAFRKNEYNKRKHIEALMVLGGKCQHCGYDKDTRGLQIDRINGGHRKWSKENKTTSHQLDQWIINHPKEAEKDWQVLCATCNTIKAMTNHERPRKYKKYAGVM